MTPKEKAIDLIDRYYSLFSLELENTIDITEAQECALIAVDEIIDTLYEYHYDSASGAYEFWTEVKEELEKL